MYSTSGPRYILFGYMDPWGKGLTKACGGNAGVGDRGPLVHCQAVKWHPISLEFRVPLSLAVGKQHIIKTSALAKRGCENVQGQGQSGVLLRSRMARAIGFRV